MKKLLALTLALLALTACAPAAQETPDGGEYGLWFAVRADGGQEGASVVEPETRRWEEEPTALELMKALLNGPEDGERLYAPFPQGVAVRDISFDEETATVQVNLSEQYGGLAGFDLTVADYCIALTLCQLPGVENVRVLVDGASIPYRSRQNLQAGDVLLSGIGEEPDSFLATLFFPSPDGERLAVEYRPVARSGDSAAETVVTELLRGPANADGRLPLPQGTRLLSLTVSSGLCRVNLSAEFVDNAPESEEQASLTLYALVNTLCTLSTVSRVQLLVEGESVASYGGVATDMPLSDH